MVLRIHNPYTAHVSTVLKIPSITFTDSEPVPIADYLTFPFTSVILTPTTFRKRIPRKHVIVDSYKELAYLHPDVYTPDPTILEQLRVKPGERYIVMRFVSWEASHDVAGGGFSNEDKVKLVESLKGKVRIVISGEKELPSELRQYGMRVPPHRFHDMIAFSTMLVTDSQTVTTEAACLGVPVVRCNSFVGEDDMGNFIELEKKYGLIFSFQKSADAITKAGKLLDDPDLKPEWRERRNRMLNEKVNMTEYLVDMIETWPKALESMK
jgi:hypothetical protein